MKTMMNEFLIRSTYRRFMGKMILNNLVVFLGSAVNGIVISRFLGMEAMEAFQLTLPLVFVVMMFSQIISLGVQNNCAKSIGAGRGEEAGEYYSAAILFALPFSLALLGIVFYEADLLVLGLGAGSADGNLAFYAAEYLRGISFGLPLLLYLPMQISVLFLEGRSKVAIQSIFMQTAVNILGAFANALYLEGGMFGMGMVMSLSYFTSMVVMFRGLFSHEGVIRFSCRDAVLWRIFPVFRIGLPSAVDRFYKTLQMYVINRVLLLVAPGTALAAFADINALNNIFNPIVMGLSATALTMAGVFAGEGDRVSLHYLFRVAVGNAFLVAFLATLGTTLAAPLLIALFVGEAGEAFDTAVTALRIYIWYLPFHAVNNTLQKYYLGINAMKMTYLTSLLDNLLFICVLSVALGYFFGPEGVWFSFLLAEILTTITLVAVIIWKKGGFPLEVGDFLCLPEKFQSFLPHPFTKSATSMEEVVQISEEARQFLLSHGEGTGKAMLMALAIEEMGGNIIHWGFREGKNHSIDVLITKGESWSLRIRDDGVAFDPKKWLELHREADPTKNIGIRAVCGMAEEVRYSRTMGLNYLLIRL